MQVMQAATKYRDPLKRLTPMPLVTDLSIMGRKVRLESNSETLFAGISSLFDPGQESSANPPDFLWQLIGEIGSGDDGSWPEMAAFSDEGLRYVNLGQRSFFAIDLDSKQAIAFLSDDLARDPVGLSSVFAATLFDLMASALGLVQISAACVSLHGRALLVMGPPHSGKTTSTYLAGKLGLEFHADQASFLDFQPDGLRVWGQFWPAAFRPDSVKFLPELKTSTGSFTYGDLTFLCFARHPFQASRARAVIPVGCVFLERHAASVPYLIPLAPAEREDRLSTCLSFQDEARFAPQITRALSEIGKLPAYRLPYGDDPAVAATFLRSILTVHHSLETTR
jgi:hypothetical protein